MQNRDKNSLPMPTMDAHSTTHACELWLGLKVLIWQVKWRINRHNIGHCNRWNTKFTEQIHYHHSDLLICTKDFFIKIYLVLLSRTIYNLLGINYVSKFCGLIFGPDWSLWSFCSMDPDLDLDLETFHPKLVNLMPVCIRVRVIYIALSQTLPSCQTSKNPFSQKQE